MSDETTEQLAEAHPEPVNDWPSDLRSELKAVQNQLEVLKAELRQLRLDVLRKIPSIPNVDKNSGKPHPEFRAMALADIEKLVDLRNWINNQNE